MPKVNFVRKAQKDNAVAKRGESYYWWKFRYGPKQMSKTRPKPSDLTQSQYLKVIYACQERFQYIDDPTQLDPNENTAEEICNAMDHAADECESIADDLVELVAQYEEKATNIEENFENSELAENMHTAGDECQTTVDDLRELSSSLRDAANWVDPAPDPAPSPDDIQTTLDSINFDEPNFDFHEV